ncbi:hypothetical protein LEN26_007087 [Aphanomyces euteiches]|nr:hypothetical protein LEN26_007087 [Aphanomyces euteiches]
MSHQLRQRRQSETSAVDIELALLEADLQSPPKQYEAAHTPPRHPSDTMRYGSEYDDVSSNGLATPVVGEASHSFHRFEISSEGTDRLELKISSPEIVRSVNAPHARKQTSRPPRDMMVYVPTSRDTIRACLRSSVGVYLEVTNTFLSVLCCVTYLIELYCPDVYSSWHFRQVELAATVYFALHYALHLYSEEDTCAFMLSFNGLIDLTIPPSIVMYFVSDPSAREVTIFRVLRVFRALRVLRLHSLTRSRKHGYNYEWGVFIFSIAAVTFVAAGIFHALEDYPDRDRPLQFHDSLYYILVTLSTIGYGDIVPTRVLSEFFVMGLIICVVTTVPAQISRLHALHVANHPYDGSYVSRPGRGHVIVCGHVAHDAFADFLAEFYHPTRGVISFDVVVLCDAPPSPAMSRLLSNINFANKTKYLRGSLVNDVDRQRTKLDSAEAVFVLADKDTAMSEAQDAATLLQALSIRNFADSAGCPIRVYLQMVSDAHNELSHIIGANQTINSNRIKADLVCRGVVCPGSCALILNLMQSVDQAKMRKLVPNPSPWMLEYIAGMSYQVYAILLSDAFDGHLYEDIARRFYNGFEVVLLAVYRRDSADDRPSVRLTPFGKPLRDGDIGFILATNAAVVPTIQANYSALVENEVLPPSPRSSTRAVPFISKSNLLQRLTPRNVRRVTPSPMACSPSTSDNNTIDAQLSRAIQKDLAAIRGHVVICGATRHVLPLVLLLRQMYDQIDGTNTPALVFLVDELPTAASFDQDAVLPDEIFFVRGVSTKCADLARVAVQHAKAVLLFPLASHNQDHVEDLIDYDVVTSLLCLETACDPSHAAFGKQTAAARDEVAFYAQQHDRVSLTAVQSRMRSHFPKLDPTLFQEASIQTLSHRLSFARLSMPPASSSRMKLQHGLCDLPSVAVLQRGSNMKFCRPRDGPFGGDAIPYLSPAYAAGRVFVDSRLDLVLCQAFYNPYITEILHTLTGSPLEMADDDDGAPPSPLLVQADIPSDFVESAFGDLFVAMLRQNKVVLALYRYPHASLGNVIPYVLTSPAASLQIHPRDKMFLLADVHHRRP